MSRHRSLARISRSCCIHAQFLSSARRYSTARIAGSSSLSDFTKQELEALLPTQKSLNLWRGDDVTVAMSGGVDSSVVLRILSEFDVNIKVIFMRNWDSMLSESSPEDQDLSTSLSYSGDPSSSSRPELSPCGWQRDWEYVQKVCEHVGIPAERVQLVDLSREYWTRVFEPAIEVWENGGTPNPDVACNREIKFGALVKHIPRHPRSFIATGHYARAKRVTHAIRLIRSNDPDKDQTYFLSSISEDQLKRAIFPLAEIPKDKVRRLARYYGLPTAEREESMGLCFVGERGKFGSFLAQYMTKPPTPGYLVDSTGKRLKEHDGLWNYTAGQKAAIGGMLEKYFVAKKGVGESGQDILVVPGRDNPALMCTRVMTHDFHWIHAKVPKGISPGGVKMAYVQLRHRMQPVPAIISHNWDGAGITVDFPEAIHGVAPGQVLTVYYNTWCLGSGVIRDTWTADVLPARSIQQHKREKGKAFRDDDEDECELGLPPAPPREVRESIPLTESSEDGAEKAGRPSSEPVEATLSSMAALVEEESKAKAASPAGELSPLLPAVPTPGTAGTTRATSTSQPIGPTQDPPREESPSAGTFQDPLVPRFLRLYDIDPNRDIKPYEVVAYPTDKDIGRSPRATPHFADFEDSASIEGEVHRPQRSASAGRPSWKARLSRDGGERYDPARDAARSRVQPPRFATRDNPHGRPFMFDDAQDPRSSRRPSPSAPLRVGFGLKPKENSSNSSS